MQSTPPSAILGPMRLPFLVLNPVCVLLGASAAAWVGNAINPYHLVLVFVGAVAAHISVNALNEYDDFRTGLDFHTQRTPFSGGSGTLPQHPELSKAALKTGLIALGIAVVIGIYFVCVQGIWLLPLGIIGLFTVATYTRYLTKNPLLCLLAPGIGFGPCMVMGTAFALSGAYTWTAFTASLVPFFLVSNLLLLNQFPDVEADKQVGRRHFPITVGRKLSVRLYGGLLAGAYLTVILGTLCGVLPAAGLLALITLALAVPTYIGVSKYSEQTPKLLPFLGRNVFLVLLTPTLLAIGLFFAG